LINLGALVAMRRFGDAMRAAPANAAVGPTPRSSGTAKKRSTHDNAAILATH